MFRKALGNTQPYIQWLSWFFQRVKRPGREFIHSPATSAQVTNLWSCTSALLCALLASTRTTLPFASYVETKQNLRSE